MAEEVAKYPIKIPVESNAAEAISPLERLKASIQGSQEAVKGYQTSLRSLTGTSAEVKSAKAQLKAAIDAEKTSLTQSTLALVKAGTSIDKLTAAEKKLAEQTKKAAEASKKQGEDTSKALGSIGGPVEDLKSKFASLEDILGGATSAEGALAVGAAGAVAAIALLGAGVVALGAKLFDFILTSGNVLRTQQLTREAFLGSAEEATRLGNQIEELGRKVPTTREQLNAMAQDLAQANLHGQTLVDTLNLTAQATSALNASAASKLNELVKRGAISGRFALGQYETLGTGIAFQDVAKALAANTKTSVEEASRALLQGQVTLGSGAEALRTAVESKFGRINLAKMLDLDVIKTKAKDALAGLTKGVNLDPLLEALGKAASLLDTSTESGTDLKLLITQFGMGVAGTLTDAIPKIKLFGETLIGYGLETEIAYYQVKLSLKDTFGADTIDSIDLVGDAVAVVDDNVEGLAVTTRFLVSEVQTGLEVLKTEKETLESLGDAVRSLHFAFETGNWAGIGASIHDGIIDPMRKIIPDAEKIAGDMLDAVKKKLEIHSPSAAAAREVGEPTGQGVAQGQSKGYNREIERIQARSSAGAAASDAGGSPGAGSAVPSMVFQITVDARGSNMNEGAVANLKQQIKQGVTQALEVFVLQRGLRVT